MNEAIVLAGRGAELVALSEAAWWAELERHVPAVRRRHEALPALHREVRRAAVRLLVATGRPVAAAGLAREVGAAVGEVEAALSDLERGLFFLVRDGRGEVSWAFPVTADVTPHALAFASGERLHGAWAEDAFATPFVQGRLLGRNVAVAIASRCAACAVSIRIEVDEELRWRAPGAAPAGPLVFEPEVDWSRFAEPNILHAYWRHSELFCTEEHARSHRRRVAWPDGLYLTLDQSARSSRLVQGALFGVR